MAVLGVVCEGQSDFAILDRVLRKLWPDADEVLLLQPILDSLGRAQGSSGASGVQAWCERNANKLPAVIDPGVGAPLDLLVVALDADAAIASGVEDPPASPSAYDASRLCKTMRGWLGKTLPRQLVITIPAMAIESWVVAALYKHPAKPEILPVPAKILVEKGRLVMDTKPKRQHKVIKPPAVYRELAQHVAAKWARVKKACGEAERFDRKVASLRKGQ
jgi:hypothetical protein